jgi:hypothetical protein
MFTGIGGYIIGGRRAKEKLASNGATLGFEKQLWKAADALRRNMDAAEYKHVVLGLIFLKYISDSFGDHYKRLRSEPQPTPRARMSIAPTTSSGCRGRRTGPICRTTPKTRKSASSLTPRWMRLNETTPRWKGLSRRSMRSRQG